MIRKSTPSGFDPMGGNLLSETITRRRRKHDPEKREPVFRE